MAKLPEPPPDQPPAVPDPQIQAAEIRRPEQAVLHALHDGRSRSRGGDDVESELVAQLVGARDDLDVEDRAVGPKPGDRLVLRAVIGVRHAVAVLERGLGFAPDRARIAGAGAAPDGLVGLPADALDLLERSQPEVPGGQDPGRVQTGRETGRSLRAQIPALRGLGHGLRQPLANLAPRSWGVG